MGSDTVVLVVFMFHPSASLCCILLEQWFPGQRLPHLYQVDGAKTNAVELVCESIQTTAYHSHVVRTTHPPPVRCMPAGGFHLVPYAKEVYVSNFLAQALRVAALPASATSMASLLPALALVIALKALEKSFDA